jgi:hypothetical protein
LKRWYNIKNPGKKEGITFVTAKKNVISCIFQGQLKVSLKNTKNSKKWWNAAMQIYS